ncbi:ACT domain-containing protein [Luteimonas sp. SDU101]|uniref:ACT domain-containing protein n=1 Tax=unclassified Luteimonas TaxID=2629088 RepID=UPI003EBF9F8B
METVSVLEELLVQLRPELDAGRYAFVTLPAGSTVDPALVVASIREREGLSLIVPEQLALARGWPVAFTAAWITLTVHSDLAAVGLTAAVSQALARAGISCNMVAGVRHDHLFVPVGQAQTAMETLQALSRTSARSQCR